MTRLINSDNFKNTRSRWNCFSKVDILGSFDFYTLTVSLDSITSDEVSGITLGDFRGVDKPTLSMAEYERLKKVLPLAAHEFTHYFDGTSTLWGMQHLSILNRAAQVHPTSEEDFHQLKSLYDHVRRLRLPDYYTTIDKRVSFARPWILTLTGGREFTSAGAISSRPILFGRFYNSQHEPIARSPISIVSLLETSAMATELEVRMALARRLGDERLVEERQISAETVAYIYNPDLTEYSVCAHLVANTTNCPDILVAFRMAAYVARFVLNCPRSIFETAARHLKNWAEAIGLPRDSSEYTLMRHAMNAGNHGALFRMIIAGLPANVEGSPTQFAIGFQRSLSIMGIRFVHTLGETEREIEVLAENLLQSPLDSLQEISRAGLENFTKTKGDPFSRPVDQMNLPAVFLGDVSQYQLQKGDNSLQELDLEKSYSELVEVQLRCERFAEACL